MSTTVTTTPQSGAGAASSPITLVTRRDALAATSDEIDSLLVRMDAPATTRLPATLSWLEHHPRVRPWVVLVRDGQRLTAAALLGRRDIGMASVISSLGEPHLPGRLVAVDAPAARLLADAIQDELYALHRPWQLRLNTMDHDDPAVESLARSLYPSRLEVVASSPRLLFAPGEALTTYLSRNTRSARAKARNRITKAGHILSTRWHTTPADIERQLAEVVEVCRDRDRHSGQNRVLDHAAARDLYVDLLRAYADQGDLRLCALRIDGALAAFAVCLRSGGMLYVHSNRAAPAWLDYSPGLIVNAEVVEAAFADDELHGVDWGGSPQRFKMSGGAVLHDYVTLRAWSSSAARSSSLAVARARCGAADAVHWSLSALARRAALRSRTGGLAATPAGGAPGAVDG